VVARLVAHVVQERRGKRNGGVIPYGPLSRSMHERGIVGGRSCGRREGLENYYYPKHEHGIDEWQQT